MANGGSIKYNIGFNVDKSGLNELKSSLQEIKNMTAKDFMDINGGNDLTKAKNELEKIHQTLGKVDAAFESAFNSDLGTLNIAKFNQTLSSSGLTIQKIQADLARTGTAGQNAFRNMTSQILTTNMKLKESHTLIDSMATTMANTIKWGAASSVMNSFTGTVQRAYGYVKNLDSSLNDIRIVTGKSADEMDRFAEKANKAAKNLGQTTTNYTDAALIYYQQGLSDAEAQARAEVTLKAANVTGQSGAEVSEQLTAVWNGYKVSAEEAELYIDKLAAVAATTASDLEELSTGMSKVASAANLMGVDVDQLNAQLATIVSVTRQAPESVGTALKTIYARMGDIEAGLDSETTLGDYTEKMAAMGVNVLDMNGQLRDMGDVMEEIGGKWTSMSREQQIYLSQVMAGTRQYNNLLSLFDNWDQYTKSLETSVNAAGTLQEQQDIHMESTEAHLAQLKASWEDLYDSLLDADAINGVSDALSGIVSLMANFVDSIGGGSGVLLTLGSIGMQVFGKHIASGLATTIVNMRAAKENTAQLIAEMEILNQFENANIDDARTQRLIEMKRQQLDLTKMMTAEERNVSNEYINQQNELYKEQDIIEENLKLIEESYKRASGKDIKLTHNTDALTGKVTIDNQQEVKDTLQTKAGDLLSEAKGLEDSQETVDAFQRMTEAAREYHNEMELGRGKIKASEEEAITVWTETNDVIIENIQLARDLAQSDKVSAENKEELNEALKEWNRLTKDGTEVDLTNIRVMEQAEKVRNAHIKTLKTQGKEYQNQVATLDNSSGKIENNNAQVKNLTQTWKNFIDRIDLKNNIMQFTTLIGKVGQIASGINSLKQIPSIFNNEDLSAGEKFLQIISSLSMGLPMLINGVMGSVTAYKALTASLKSALLMSELKQMSDLKGIGLENTRNTLEAKQAILQAAKINLNKKEIESLTEKEIIQLLVNKAKAGEIAPETIGLTMQRLKILQNKEETTSLLALAAARAKDIALKVIGDPLYLATAVAVAAVAAAVWTAVRAYESEAEAAKRATEAVKLQREALNQIKTEYDELKSAIEDHKNAQDAIKDLTKGTQEWRDAVNEANQSVLELMQTFPELADAIDNVDGQLIIDTDSDAFEEFQKKQEERLNEAQRDLYTAEISKIKADNNLLYSNTKISYDSKSPKGAGGYAAVSQGASVSVISDEILKKIVNAINTQGSGFLGNKEDISTVLDIEDEDLIKAIYDNSSELSELAEAVNANTAAIKIYEGQLGDSYLQGVEAYENSDYKEALAGAVGSLLDEEANQIYEAEYKNKSDALVRAEYQQAIGATQSEAGEDGKSKYFINGEWQEIDNAAAKMKLAMDKAAVDVGVLAENLSNIVDDKVGDSEDNVDIKEAILGFANQGIGDLSSLTKNELTALGKLEFSKDEANQLEYETAKALMDAISEQIDAELAARSTQTDTALDEALGRDGASREQRISIRDALKDIDLKEYGDFSPEEFFAEIDFSKIPSEGVAEWFRAALEEGAANLEIKEALSSENLRGEGEAEKLGIDVEEFKIYRDLLAEENEELAKQPKLLNDVAIANTRFNKGVNKLASNWKDLKKVLSNSDSSLDDIANALKEVNPALQDMLNYSDEDFALLSPDFAKEHQKQIEDVLNGVDGAYEELMSLAAEDIIFNMRLDEAAASNLYAEISALTDYIDVKDIEVGATLDSTGFTDVLNQMIMDGEVTAEQVTKALQAIQFEPELTYKEVPADTDAHEFIGQTVQVLNPATGEIEELTLTSEHIESGYTLVRVPVINGAKTTYNGPSHSTRAGGARTKPKSGGGGGKGGGGKGGGGGSKAKDPNKKDPITEERDLYHDINYELEQINNELTKQERLTEKLTGKNKIDALNKELEILEKQADAEHRKLLLLQNERDTLKETLKGDGVLFDSEGDISNYNAALDAKLAALNEMINRYNAMSAEEQEKFESELETAQEAYEKFKEDMERYDELMTSEIFEAQERIDDILDQQVEKNIEQLEVEIELNIDTKEAERQLREFVKDFVKQIEEDDFANNAIFSQQQLNSYLGTDGDLAVYEKAMRDAYEAYQKIQAGGTDDIYGNDAEKAKEAFENYRDEVYDIYGEMGDLIDEVYEAQLDGIDEVNDKLDEQLEKYEQLYDTVERNLETSKLLQGEDDYETQLKYYNQMKAVNMERQKLLQDEVIMWKHKIEVEIEAGRENSEAVKAMQEHLTEAQEELANTTAESLELIAESYEIAKQKLTKDMDLAATGGKGLNYLAQEWELLNDNADMYLDAVNSAYEISQLESKVLDAIDNTDSVYAQEKLNKLMDAELGKLREKEKITKYDIERANKLLDIELQKIALEEAQASKTQMRLRRDSQGNYTYQYVSDQDKVREAQEALEQAQNELYNMDKDAYKNNLDEIQSAYQDYIDEVNDLNILYADNEEEFYNQLILLNEKYNERIDGLTDQNKTIGFNLQGSTLDMVAKITGMDADALQMLSTKEIDKIMAQYIPQWSSGVAEMVAKLANGGFNELSEQLVEQLLKLEDSQKAEMDAAALQGNESLNNIANGADVVKDKINELGAETRDTFNEMDAMLKSLSESALKTEEIANNLKEAAEASAQIANNGNPLVYEKASGVDISDGKLDFSNSDSEIEGMNFKQYDNIQSTNSSANKEWYGNKNSILNGLENRIEKVPSDSLDAKKSILNGVEYSQFLIDKLNTSIEDKINQLEKYISNRQNKNPFVTEDLSKELNQSITINADFPDATNAKEIEDAFNNLINAASQYAYKVKK